MTARPLWKLDPYAHQGVALSFAAERDYYALLMEQGTGKTPVFINDAARRYDAEQVDTLLVMAPSGVHSNWILREIPKHLPDWCPRVTAAWYASPNRAEKEKLRALTESRGMQGLRVLAMNWEALTLAKGLTFAMNFLKSARRGTMTVGDESQKAKNPKAIRTKRLLRFLKPLSKVRAIGSGTAILNSPWDAFSQFGWLNEQFLRIQSFPVFKAEYAELLPPDHGLLRHITMRLRPAAEARIRPGIEIRWQGEFLQAQRRAILSLPAFQEFSSLEEMEENVRLEIESRITAEVTSAVNEALARKAPQIVARDSNGLRRWRNLDQLERLIAPHAYRVLKKDCLDLPPKVFTQRFYRMTAKQREAYKLLKNDIRLQLLDGTILPIQRIAALTKLSQIVSGYFIVPGTQNVTEPDAQLQRLVAIEDNPKLLDLWDEVETCLESDEQVIIWARFHVELDDISFMLRKHGVPHVEYHGDVKRRARQEGLDAFERGEKKVFLGQQAAGGTGITAVAPNSIAAQMSVIYYSNTWSLEDRVQSEDRPHRIGQSKTVRYVDQLCKGTIEENIVAALLAKIDLASTVLGDKRRALELLESAEEE